MKTIKSGFTPLEMSSIKGITSKKIEKADCKRNTFTNKSRPPSCFRKKAGGLSLTGFTLLEVLISLAIVSITLVVLIPSQLLSIRQGTLSKHYTTAVFLGNEILSDTFMQENLITGSDSADFEDYPEFSWTREVENTEIAELRKVKIVILGPEHIRIVLNTYWMKK